MFYWLYRWGKRSETSFSVTGLSIAGLSETALSLAKITTEMTQSRGIK